MDTALAAAGANDTIVLLKGLEVIAQINVAKSVTIEGAGHTIKANNASWLTDNSNKHLLNIVASNVTVQNLTLDSNNQAYGNQAYSATGVAFNDVTMVNSKGAGLTVNRSTVTAENLTTSDNAWGGVNVDGGAPHFTLTGNSTLNENNQIWAEKANGPAVVDANGYYCHLTDDGKFYAWSTSVSDTAAAKVKVGEVDVYYTSLEKALSETTGTVEITLVKGKIATVPAITDRMVTLVGEDKEASIIDMTKSGIIGAQNANLELTIKNATVKFDDKTNYKGITHSKKVVYEGCIIEGKQFLYAESVEFKSCKLKNSNDYCLWTYGSANVLFDTCTFNTGGKAIFIYNEKTNEGFTAAVTVNNCIFNDDDTLKADNGTDDLLKAAIETGSNGGNTETSNKYTIVVNNATVNGFAVNTTGINTGSKLWANKNSMDAEHLTVIIDNKYVLGTETPKQTVTVATAEELKEKLTTLTSAGSGNNVINIDGDFQLANGETWTPVTVDGYNGAGVITINGNGHTIKGLNAPLIAGGFAGKSGVVIKDLTLENVTINDTTSNQGIGAFIGNVDSMPQIDLDNCHLINSNITSTDGARVGGLIGWTSGYNNPNDGPVNTCVSITNCSVENCAITAKGSVGAIIGHAGANPATYHTITGCTVKDCTLTSTDDGGWRVGVVVGTANVGEVTIKNITTDNNTVTQTGKTAPEGQSDLYGRFVPGETGKLTIDNIEIK